jgi:hypothetical protein
MAHRRIVRVGTAALWQVDQDFEWPLRGRFRSYAGFHFGTQPSVTYQDPGAPTGAPNSSNRLFQVLLGAPGFKNRRTENPRVGGSIPPLATIKSIA